MNSKSKNQTSQYLAGLIDLIFDQPQPPPIPIPYELTSPGPSNTDSYLTDKQAPDTSQDSLTVQQESERVQIVVPDCK
jgi:hypothetical protein